MRAKHPFRPQTMVLTLFTGCAPMMSAPPSTPMRVGSSNEVNHGVPVGLRPETVRSEQNRDDTAVSAQRRETTTFMPMGNYHLSIRRPIPGSGNEFGTLFQAGYPSIISAGGYYRVQLIGGEKTYIGAQGSLGWLWAGAAIPMAFKTSDTVWVTTQPSMSVGTYGIQLTRVPIGLSWELGDFNRFDAEIGGTIEGKSDQPGLGEHYHGYVGVHFSRQIRPKKKGAPTP